MRSAILQGHGGRMTYGGFCLAVLQPIIEREVDAGRGDYLSRVADIWAHSYPDTDITPEGIRRIIIARQTSTVPDGKPVEDSQAEE